MNNADTLQWLTSVLSLARSVAYAWDIDSDRLNWSNNTSVLGLEDSAPFPRTRHEMIQQIHPDDRDRACLVWVQAKSSGEPFTLHYRWQPADSADWIDITETGRREGERLVGLMMHNEETGGPQIATPSSESANAYHYPDAFLQQLEQIAALRREDGHTGGLLIVSIDNLPMVVSGYGHDKAEEILASIAQAISDALEEDTPLYRIQRDEFALIIPMCGEEKLHHLAREINQQVKQFGMRSEIGPLHVLSSIGSTVFPNGAKTAVEMIDKAYVALKSDVVPGHRSYEEDAQGAEASIHQMEMTNYLHRAMHADKLRLAYQPIIETNTGKVAFYECLLRLVNDDGQLTSAGALVPVAEKMGLIDQIDQLVLEMVVEDLLRSPEISLTFNISNLTTTNPEWMDIFSRILESTPEIAPRMIVEITETAAQRDIRETAYFVASLQALGCRVALDDFGSGYTSFRQLKALSCDIVKIDGEFIRNIATSTDNRFFVRTLLEFTEGYGLEAVAEFVENGEIAKILMDMGVHYMQGHYFGRAEDGRAWLGKHHED